MRTTLESLKRREYRIKRIDIHNIIAISHNGKTTYTLYDTFTTDDGGEKIYQSQE